MTSGAQSPGGPHRVRSEERREAVLAIREVILANLPPGYEEGMHYEMIGYGGSSRTTRAVGSA